MDKKVVVKKSSIIMVLTFLNGVISFIFAKFMHIDVSLKIDISLFWGVLKLWLIPSLLLGILTGALCSRIFNTINQKVTKSTYLVLFFGLVIVNILVFSLNVNINY